MNHIIHAAYTSLHTHGGKTTNFTSNGARRGRWDNFTNNRNLGRIIVLVDFTASTILEKHRIRVVLAMKMAQAFSISKAQTKGFFNVGRFHLAPSVIVIFYVHVLHLFRNSHWLADRGELK